MVMFFKKSSSVISGLYYSIYSRLLAYFFCLGCLGAFATFASSACYPSIATLGALGFLSFLTGGSLGAYNYEITDYLPSNFSECLAISACNFAFVFRALSVSLDSLS